MTTIATVLFIAAFGLCFLSLVNAACQPTRAFRAAGYHKSAWVVLLILGMFTMIVGVIIWVVWRFRVSPRVVAAGGRPSRGYQASNAAIPSGGGYTSQLSGWAATPAPGACMSRSAACSCAGGTNTDITGHSVCGGSGLQPCLSCGQRH